MSDDQLRDLLSPYRTFGAVDAAALRAAIRRTHARSAFRHVDDDARQRAWREWEAQTAKPGAA